MRTEFRRFRGSQFLKSRFFLQLFSKDYIVFLISNKTFPIFEHLAGATEYHPLLLFNLKKMKTV